MLFRLVDQFCHTAMRYSDLAPDSLDAHLLAFDRSTGRVLWDVVLADYRVGYAATLAAWRRLAGTR